MVAVVPIYLIKSRAIKTRDKSTTLGLSFMWREW
jgi:hypothetical protein